MQIAYAIAQADNIEDITSYEALDLGPENFFQSAVQDLCGLFVTVHDSKVYFIYQTAREFLIFEQHQGVSDSRVWQGDNGLSTFFEACYSGMEVLHTEADFYELAMEYFVKAAAMNVRYAAPFYDPQAHTRRGVPLEFVMRGLQRARDDARGRLGVHADYTLCFLRDMPPELAMETYEAALEFREVFYAVGLDSNEYERPPSLFEEVFLHLLRKITNYYKRM